MGSLLKVAGLKAGYGQAQVLFGVDFEMTEGEVVTLLGRNGMGRSTTIKCLFGLLQPTGGSIEFNGQRTETWPSHQIARLGLGLVPEGRQVFPNLTVEENLLATARQNADNGLKPWTLERVYGFFPRLRERRSNLGSQLSGGEQQQLAIARALVARPDALLLDEPSLGLAPQLVDVVFQALASIRERGVTVLLVEQRAQRTVAFADRTYVISNGELTTTLTQPDAHDTERMVAAYFGT